MAWKASEYALKLLARLEAKESSFSTQSEKLSKMPYKASAEAVRTLEPEIPQERPCKPCKGACKPRSSSTQGEFSKNRSEMTFKASENPVSYSTPQNPEERVCNELQHGCGDFRNLVGDLILEKGVSKSLFDRINQRFAGRTALTLNELAEYMAVSTTHLIRLIQLKELKRVDRSAKITEAKIELVSLIRFLMLRLNVMKCKAVQVSDGPLILAGQDVGQELYLAGFAKRYSGKDSISIKSLASFYNVPINYITHAIRGGALILTKETKQISPQTLLQMESVVNFIRSKFSPLEKNNLVGGKK